MRINLLLSLLIIVLGGCASVGEKAEQPAPHYPVDLGMTNTPWGVLHSFDRVHPAKTVPPKYPIEERRSGVTGEVALAVLVGEDGSVADVRVLKSSGNYHFDDAALESVRQWKYRPLDPRERFVTIQPIVFNIAED